jgi:dTMP kinase
VVDPARGVFITFEGPDGSGKSSLMPRLAAVLAVGGCEVVTTREPGSTPFGELMRRLVLDTDPPIDRGGRADALLFAASRAQHVDEVISPALARGAVVLCDRYADSSLAYQGAGSGVPMDQLREVQRFATGGLVPDLTILLDLPVEVGLARKSAEITRFEAFQDTAYHERVRGAFWASPRQSQGGTRSWTRPASPRPCWLVRSRRCGAWLAGSRAWRPRWSGRPTRPEPRPPPPRRSRPALSSR